MPHRVWFRALELAQFVNAAMETLTLLSVLFEKYYVEIIGTKIDEVDKKVYVDFIKADVNFGDEEMKHQK